MAFTHSNIRRMHAGIIGLLKYCFFISTDTTLTWDYVLACDKIIDKNGGYKFAQV